MDPISIASLIYASPRYARHLWDMLRRTTPELERGEAEFFFIANDPTEAVLDSLQLEAIPYVLQRNEHHTEAELMARGIGAPEYLHRVYRGWNRAVLEARHDCLVLLNSDHIVPAGWLGELRARWHPGLALSPLSIEPAGPYGVFAAENGGGTGAVEGEHGDTLDTFDLAGFEAHAAELRQEQFTPGGAYQPVMISRSAIIAAGLYPEGNLHAGSFQQIQEYADRRLFRTLAMQGIEHRTYHGVVVYHFHEGEMREATLAERDTRYVVS